MNKVLLEKLRKIIKNVSCNSLKCVYQHQLEEWLEIDSDECSKFIRELVEENLIEEKYDFQCECGNDCTVYHRLLLTEDFQCSECERKYNKDDIKSKAEVLYEIDKQAVMDYKEEYTAINSQIRSFVEYKRNVRQDEIRQIDYEAIGVERQVKKPRVFLSYSHKDEEYKKELDKLQREMKNPGFTIVPVRLFINEKGLAKLVVALAKGKKEYDKRESIKEKDDRRDMARMFKR